MKALVGSPKTHLKGPWVDLGPCPQATPMRRVCAAPLKTALPKTKKNKANKNKTQTTQTKVKENLSGAL